MDKDGTAQMTAKEESKDVLEIHKIAHEQGLIGLNLQEAGLTALRQRATAIISISGLAATFLGREALQVPSGMIICLNIGMFEWAALFFLGISVVCTIMILKPRTGWTFHYSPSLIVKQFAQGEKATDLSTTYRVLSEFSETNYKKNSKILDPLYKWFNYSLVAVILQIIFWIISIR